MKNILSSLSRALSVFVCTSSLRRPWRINSCNLPFLKEFSLKLVFENVAWIAILIAYCHRSVRHVRKICHQVCNQACKSYKIQTCRHFRKSSGEVETSKKTQDKKWIIRFETESGSQCVLAHLLMYCYSTSMCMNPCNKATSYMKVLGV